MRNRWLPLSVGGLLLLFGIGLLIVTNARKSPPAPMPPDRLTIAPTLMTYEELAQRLSTPTHQVQVDNRLRRRGVLIALKNRSHARDERLFDAYVRVITQQVRQELDQYAPLLAQPRQQLKQLWEQSPNPSSVAMELSALLEPSKAPPIGTAEKERFQKHRRLYWVQSLDGYVMLRWLHTHWNESLARELIQNRMVKFERPLAMGLPGITPNDVDEFLCGQPGAKTWLELVQSLGKDYDWVVGVVGWDATTRTLIPYCDFVSVRRGGTGWLFVPVTLLAEPQPLEKLFEQMGEEGRAYYQQSRQAQGDFLSDHAFIEGFSVEGATHLSQVLERWARTFDREVVMELAPERETLGIVLRGRHTLRALLTDFSGVIEDQKEKLTLTVPINYTKTSVWRPETGISSVQLRMRHLAALTEPWYYEYKNGVLVARNRLAFLDRQYDYPLEAVMAFERSLQRKGKQVEIPLSALVQLGKAVLENAENPATPALGGYRSLPFLKRGSLVEMAPFFAMVDSLPNKQAFYTTLEAGKEVVIPLEQFAKQSLGTLRTLWRQTTFYMPSPISYPFGAIEAHHPRYAEHLRKAELVISPYRTETEFTFFEGQQYRRLRSFAVGVQANGDPLNTDWVTINFWEWGRQLGSE